MTMKVERIGCPACAPVPEGPEHGPGCEQCDGYGYVYKVPNDLDPTEVKCQIAMLEGKKFVAVVWCTDCNGVDFQGCFDGGVERLEQSDTPEEAEQAAISYIDGQSLWKYEIEIVEA